jgi:hypothetical protein
MLALALLGLSATAFADGRDVLADVQDNGRVDGCYTRAEFRDALRLAGNDQRLYGSQVDVIKDARITNVKVPGEPCGSARTVPETAVEDDSGGSLGIWIGLAVEVGAVAVGAGAWARRGGGRDEPGP